MQPVSGGTDFMKNFDVKFVCIIDPDIPNKIDTANVKKITKVTVINLVTTSAIVHPSGLAAVIWIRVSSVACVMVKHPVIQNYF